MVVRVWLAPYTDPDKGRRELLAVCYLEHNQITGALTLDAAAGAELGRRNAVEGGVASARVEEGRNVATKAPAGARGI